MSDFQLPRIGRPGLLRKPWAQARYPPVWQARGPVGRDPAALRWPVRDGPPRYRCGSDRNARNGDGGAHGLRPPRPEHSVCPGRPGRLEPVRGRVWLQPDPAGTELPGVHGGQVVRHTQGTPQDIGTAGARSAQCEPDGRSARAWRIVPMGADPGDRPIDANPDRDSSPRSRPGTNSSEMETVPHFRLRETTVSADNLLRIETALRPRNSRREADWTCLSDTRYRSRVQGIDGPIRLSVKIGPVRLSSLRFPYRALHRKPATIPIAMGRTCAPCAKPL